MGWRTVRRTLCGLATAAVLVGAAPRAAVATGGVTVSPNTGLVDGQEVRAGGDGLLPICVHQGGCGPVLLLQCQAAVDISIDNVHTYCVMRGEATSVGSSYSGDITVLRTFKPSSGPVVGCGTDGCVAAAAGVSYGALQFHTGAITFASK